MKMWTGKLSCVFPPREDPETIMAAVLLDREGEFHIFHDYSVPQHVDFSALA